MALAAVKSPNMQARPMTLVPAEYAITTWYVAVPPSVDLDEALQPAFWAHCARQMKPNQRVIVDSEDGTWTALLFVRTVERAAARVAVLSYVDFNEAKSGPALDAATSEEYEMKWLSPGAKYQIIRKSDRQEMGRGFEKDDAILWIRERQKVDGR